MLLVKDIQVLKAKEDQKSHPMYAQIRIKNEISQYFSDNCFLTSYV